MRLLQKHNKRDKYSAGCYLWLVVHPWLFLLFLTATPSTPAVSNVLINPSLIGSKNILITTNMVSQNSGGESLKRKHEDEDDYDALWRWDWTQPSLL